MQCDDEDSHVARLGRETQQEATGLAEMRLAGDRASCKNHNRKNEVPDGLQRVADDQVQDEAMPKAPAHEEKPSQFYEDQDQAEAGAHQRRNEDGVGLLLAPCSSCTRYPGSRDVVL